MGRQVTRMVMTPAERAKRHRDKKRMRHVDVEPEVLDKLKAYQERWELPTLSVAISHAVTFSKPE